MADIAQLGFAADTSDLSDAKAKLEAIVPAAAKAEKASDGLSKAMERANAAAYGNAAAFNASSKAAQAAAGATTIETRAVEGSSAAISKKVSWLRRLVEGLRGVKPAADAAAAGVVRVNQAANDNAGAMKANVGNIAAQFQDIGVTAAAGMSPMMIALQQGTQLASVFAASGGSAFKTLGGAILSVLSPTSLLTIGLVALAVAGLQMVDWAKLAKDAINGLADSLVELAPIAAIAGATLLVAFAPSILATIAQMTVAIGTTLVRAIVGATQALIGFALANPFGLAVIAIGALTAAAWAFDEDINRIFGFNVLATIKKAANYIIGSFVGAFHDIQFVWNNFPTIIGAAATGATNAVIRSINWLIEKGTAGINSLIDGANVALGLLGISPIGHLNAPKLAEFANNAATALQGAVTARNKQLEKDLSADYIGMIGGAIDKGAKWARGKLKAFAATIGQETTKPKKDKADKASTGKTDEEKFEDILNKAQQRIAAMKAELAGLDLSAEAAARLKYETELLNQAMQAGIQLTPQQTAKLKELAGEMARLEIATKDAKTFKDIMKSSQERISSLEQEKAMIGMTADETLRYKNETIWLNEQLAKFVNATPEQVEALRQQAEAMSGIEIATRRAKDTLDFAKSATRGFIDDLRSGLAEGKSLWEAFGTAVVNVLNKIIDKLLDSALDQLFSPGGGGGGILGALAGLFGGGGGGGGAYGVSGSEGIYAKGGAFGNRAQLFASGGAFSNSIVSGATPFAYGQGGSKTGIMGEAGPEAVMPLTRGPDGSLGVQMYGQGSGNAGGMQQVLVRVEAVEGDMFKPRVEAIAESKAITVTEAGLTQFNNHLPERFQQIANDERAR